MILLMFYLLGASDWKVSQTTDPITDEAQIVGSKYSEDGTAIISISCVASRPEMFIQWQEVVGSGVIKVTTRVDKNKPEDSLWNVSKDGTKTFCSFRVTSTLTEMAKGSALIVRVYPATRSPITVVFDLSGLMEITKDFTGSCRYFFEAPKSAHLAPLDLSCLLDGQVSGPLAGVVGNLASTVAGIRIGSHWYGWDEVTYMDVSSYSFGLSFEAVYAFPTLDEVLDWLKAGGIEVPKRGFEANADGNYHWETKIEGGTLQGDLVPTPDQRIKTLRLAVLVI